MEEIKSDVLKLMHTYEAPPEGFDPHTAQERLLRRHGFPRRPDPEKEPHLMRLWKRAFRPGIKMTKAELKIDPIMSRRNPLHSGDRFQPSGWGGVVAQTSSLKLNPAQPANTVYAQWQVPYVYPYANDNSGQQTLGFWVGIDGWGNGQVLQAGTASTVNGNNVSYWAWTEWYTTQYKDPAVAVTNFPIGPGDLISVLVCAPQNNHGYVSMMNERTQQAISVGIDARPGITSQGASVEWIVEGITSELPFFDEYPEPLLFPAVIFGNCTAGTQNHSFNLQTNGFTTNISGSGGTALTNAVIGGPNTALVLWEGRS